MAKRLFPRFSKKKNGSVTVSEGQWKIEVKERFRIIGILTSIFVFLGIIIAILAPYVLGLLALMWLISTTFLSGLLDILKWVTTWCIKQPFLDFRYGRKKRKELEDKRTYAQ